MGTWCSVVCVCVFVSSGFTSNVLAFSHFHRQRTNGIVCYTAHKYWCANELYYLVYTSVVAQMNMKVFIDFSVNCIHGGKEGREL